MSILIVDSAGGSDLNTRAIFEEYGYQQLRLVKSATEMRKLLQNPQALADVRLVIINGDMADADGFELCREIRGNEWGKHLYIMVLISSHENRIAIDKARHSGASDFAVKPYDGKLFKQHLALFSARHSVLLIEDDPLARQMVEKIFSKDPLEIIVIDDGLKAYNLINATVPPALVLLDIGLPGINGLNVLKHIRSRQDWKKCPVIMFTGSAEAGDVKTALTMGANDYIVKPLRPDDFRKRTGRYLHFGV